MAAPTGEIEGIHSPKATAAYVADKPLTDDQAAKLADMKVRVASVVVADADAAYWKTDGALKRFLVARGWDVKKAADMYTATMKWRCDNACGTVLAMYKEPAVMRRYFPWGIIGRDKQGFPILLERIGNVDLVGMHGAIGTPDFLSWVCYYHEVQEAIMRRVSATMGLDRHKMTVIIDMQGISLRHLTKGTLDVLKSRTRLEEDNFPEVVKRVFLINTPAMFSTVWNVVKYFMDEGTVDKMQILGSGYLPTLLEYVDPSNIPKYLGGTLVDSHGDPELKQWVAPGGTVPLAYIVGVANDGLGMGEEVSVAAGKHADVTIRAPPGATVSWKFGMGDRDVNYRVTAAPAAASGGAAAAGVVVDVPRSVRGVHQLAPGYKAPGKVVPVFTPVAVASAGTLTDALPGAGGAETDVVPTVRCDKHSGSYTVPADAPASGYVVRFRWDNSYSWMNSKTLVRRIDVILPAAAGKAEVAAVAAAADAAAATATGGAGTAAADSTTAAPAAPAADVLIEYDYLEELAAERQRHCSTFGHA